MSQNFGVIVGDAKGADLAFQNYFNSEAYEDVVVYCVGNPRNIVKDWEVKSIQTTLRPGTRQYFTAKDEQMASDCDLGFMLWDGKSQGTLKNVLELLSQGKKSLVYLSKSQQFVTVSNIATFERLISMMKPEDLEAVCKKINIEKRIELIESAKTSQVQVEMNL